MEPAPLYRKHRILALDGGPSSAIYVHLIKKIEQQRPGFLAKINLFAGTSDGSLIAMYLAAHLGDDDAANLAVAERVVGFFCEVLQALRPTTIGMARATVGFGPLQSFARLRAVLHAAFGDMTFGDIRRRGRELVVVSFDCDAWRSKIFRNFGPDADDQLTLIDAGLASCAFPVMMPTPVPSSGHARGAYLDGAMVANNPSMAAVTRAIFEERRADEIGEVLSAINGTPPPPRDRLVVLSLGAVVDERWMNAARDPLPQVAFDAAFTFTRGVLRHGFPRDPVNQLKKAIRDRPPNVRPQKERHWGWIEWLPLRPFMGMQIAVQGSVHEVDIQCQAVLDDRYFRFEPKMGQIFTVFEGLFLSVQQMIDRMAAKADRWAKRDRFREMLTWMDGHWGLEAPGLPI
jgi:hypothetical protein